MKNDEPLSISIHLTENSILLKGSISQIRAFLENMISRIGGMKISLKEALKRELNQKNIIERNYEEYEEIVQKGFSEYQNMGRRKTMNWEWQSKKEVNQDMKSTVSEFHPKKFWDEMTEQEKEERREQASVEGKAKYEKMTEEERQELKAQNFYDFKNNPASGAFLDAIMNHKDILFYHAGTTGLLGGKVADLQVKTKNGMEDADYPTQFAACVYGYCEDTGVYSIKDKIYIPMISVPDNVLKRTLKAIDAGGYDVFKTGGIDRDAYEAGKGVVPALDAAKEIDKFFEKHMDAAKTGYNTAFASNMLARDGIEIKADFDLMAVANEHHNAVKAGNKFVFGEDDIIENGKRVTLENIFSHIAPGNEPLNTAKSKIAAEAFIFLELTDRSHALEGERLKTAKSIPEESILLEKRNDLSDLRFLAEQIREQNHLIENHTQAIREQTTVIDKIWGALSIVAPSMEIYLKARTIDKTELERGNMPAGPIKSFIQDVAGHEFATAYDIADERI